MTLSRRLWRDPGERYVFQTSAALRATVNGLVLFFLYRDGQALAGATMTLSRRLWWDPGERYVFQTSAALRATVNGLVLVGVAEAVLFTFAYVGAGVAHAVVIGALTGVLSMIPLAAPVLYG